MQRDILFHTSEDAAKKYIMKRKINQEQSDTLRYFGQDNKSRFEEMLHSALQP